MIINDIKSLLSKKTDFRQKDIVGIQVEETYLEMMQRLTGQDLLCCPNCKNGRMTVIKELPNQLLDST